MTPPHDGAAPQDRDEDEHRYGGPRVYSISAQKGVGARDILFGILTSA